MVDAKVDSSVIMSQIRASSKTDFNLSSNEIIRLSKAGVPARVIEAMRNPKAIPASPVKSASVPHKTAPGTSPVSVTPPPTPAPVAVAIPPPTTLPAASTPPVSRPAAEKLVAVTVMDGQPFRIALANDIPAEVEEGQPLRFVATADFRAGDLVVIQKGAAVTGAIVDGGSKKKFFGGSKMTFRLIQVDAVDGHKLNVRAISGRGKEGPVTRPVDTNNLKRTKEIAAPAGTQYVAYVDGEQTVSIPQK
jgi:hypothetical protein